MFSDITNTYPGSLITQSDTTIAYIPNEEFQEYLFTNRTLLKNFLRLFSDKAYEMNYKSKLLSQDSVRDKIFFYLFNQRKLQKSNKIILGITKEELANQLFIQRPSLSRELIKMKQDGLIDYDLKSITIKNKRID
jgi:CRP-like cAMP-binding protein